MEKVCDLCGRSYELEHLTSHLTLGKDKQAAIYDYHICLRCAVKFHNFVFDIQRNRPTKCDFCEFDRGLHTLKPVECLACSDYNHFKLKKRMHERQHCEWKMYKRYLCGEGDLNERNSV